jgi:hypothetical protein
MRMDAKERKALSTIRRCVAAGRYRVKLHFAQRMDERGMFWPDVQAVVDSPASIRDGGLEQCGRPKWILSGTAADGLSIEMVCVLDTDERGELTVFITIY